MNCSIMAILQQKKHSFIANILQNYHEYHNFIVRLSWYKVELQYYGCTTTKKHSFTSKNTVLHRKTWFYYEITMSATVLSCHYCGTKVDSQYNGHTTTKTMDLHRKTWFYREYTTKLPFYHGIIVKLSWYEVGFVILWPQYK